ncbi:phosphatase PAP2 family protein [Microbacterium sp. NPDC055910]|uniref:phosphatase PAP2 family protein n=1 Tax=Microbacterium sp. NPDC055910 TaxID=3345659 RepID=UPI0035DA4E83
MLLYVLAVLTPLGQRLDASTLGSFPALRDEPWMRIYGARNALMLGLVVLAALAAVGALLARRFLAVAAAAICLGGTGVLAALFDIAVPRPDFGAFAYAHNTYPSGHVAVCAAGVIAIAWLNPRWAPRPVVAVLAGVVWIEAAMSLLSFAHRGSDVLGGILLAGAVAFAVQAAVGVVVSPARRLRAWTAVGSAVCLTGAVCVLIAMADVPRAPDVAGGGMLLACAGVLVVLVARQGAVASVEVGSESRR